MTYNTVKPPLGYAHYQDHILVIKVPGRLLRSWWSKMIRPEFWETLDADQQLAYAYWSHECVMERREHVPTFSTRAGLVGAITRFQVENSAFITGSSKVSPPKTKVASAEQEATENAVVAAQAADALRDNEMGPYGDGHFDTTSMSLETAGNISEFIQDSLKFTDEVIADSKVDTATHTKVAEALRKPEYRVHLAAFNDAFPK
ncbi:hypothetical protein NX059_000821 [Plenodomus lindquistii]|nr:hypothetical protein NX059_000821 [Plenodomus lindquistii]